MSIRVSSSAQLSEGLNTPGGTSQFPNLSQAGYPGMDPGVADKCEKYARGSEEGGSWAGSDAATPLQGGKFAVDMPESLLLPQGENA